MPKFKSLLKISLNFYFTIVKLYSWLKYFSSQFLLLVSCNTASQSAPAVIFCDISNVIHTIYFNILYLFYSILSYSKNTNKNLSTCTVLDELRLVYCVSLDCLIASIILLICTSLWIRASAKWFNVNVIHLNEKWRNHRLMRNVLLVINVE